MDSERQEMPFAEFPRRIAIDVSHTLASGQSSGVQRVVRNLAMRLQDHYMPVQIVMHDGSNFRAVDLDLADQTFRKLNRVRSRVTEHLPEGYRRSAELFCRAFPADFVRNFLLPEPGRQGGYRTFLKVWQKQVVKGLWGERVELGAGDLLLLPDAYWAYNGIWESVRQCRQRGAFIASVVYDLIPISHPQFVVPGADLSFRQYLFDSALNSDLMLAISSTVKRQVAETLPRLWPGQPLCKNIQAFELGAELRHVEGDISQPLQSLFQPQSEARPYLMVATLEPRKNHSYVLEAFEEIWKTNPYASICMIGRVGWLCDEILKRLKDHPRFNKQLHVLHSVSDAELSFCYQNARALIFPSITEGCGLPIVEAKWFGRQVFASDTEIHREVGKQDCQYFDLEDPTHLADLIQRWEAGLNEVDPRDAVIERPISWNESADQLLNLCLLGFDESVATDLDRHRHASSGPRSVTSASVLEKAS